MATRPELPLQRLREFCSKWKVAELAVFGSYLREDFTSESDIDFLVTWAPEADWSLLEHLSAQDELSQLLGRRVDLVTRRSVERSANYIRREHILESARVVYAA
jgi:predicted nucleotidyltransferase